MNNSTFFNLLIEFITLGFASCDKNEDSLPDKWLGYSFLWADHDNSVNNEVQYFSTSIYTIEDCESFQNFFAESTLTLIDH